MLAQVAVYSELSCLDETSFYIQRKALKGLTRSPDREFHENEFLFRGKTLKRKSQLTSAELSELESGRYSYVINEDGELSFCKTFDLDPKYPKKAFCGHMTLKLLEANQTKRILAAGDFQLQNGRVLHLDNQSGAFPNGKAAEVDFAYNVLEKSGLKVSDQHTQKFNFAKNKKKPEYHIEEKRLGDIMLNIENAPVLSKHRDLLSVYKTQILQQRDQLLSLMSVENADRLRYQHFSLLDDDGVDNISSLMSLGLPYDLLRPHLKILSELNRNEVFKYIQAKFPEFKIDNVSNVLFIRAEWMKLLFQENETVALTRITTKFLETLGDKIFLIPEGDLNKLTLLNNLIKNDKEIEKRFEAYIATQIKHFTHVQSAMDYRIRNHESLMPEAGSPLPPSHR